MKDTSLSIKELMQLVWRKRVTLICVFFVSAILSIAGSFLMTKEYKAIAKIFPAKGLDMIVNEVGVTHGNVSEFGEDEEVEQLLEIMESRSFKERIIQNHNLFEHYQIADSTAGYRTKLLKEYDKNINLNRTRFSAIEIHILDRDPEKAAEIANGIMEELDTYRGQIVEKRISNSIEYLSKKLDSMKSELEATSKQIAEMNKRGVVSKEERAGLYQSLGKAGVHFNVIKEQINQNLLHSEEYDVLEHKRYFLLNNIEAMERRMIQLEGEASGQLSSKFDLQSAVVPDKKEKPKRSIIAISGSVLTTFFVLLLLIIKEKWPLYKRQLES